MTPERDAICTAYALSSTAITDIVGDLHTLHYFGKDLTEARRKRMIADALMAAQTLLAAVFAAERAMNGEPVERTRERASA